LRLATTGLGLALALGLATHLAVAVPASPPASKSVTIASKSRSFRVPFKVDPSERARYKELQLWVSEDSGYTWKPQSISTPEHPWFTFRAARDGEFWFAVRTIDTQGRMFPGEDEQVEPKLKVVVDTRPPSLVLEADKREGGLAMVRWEVRDEHLELKSLSLEYQIEGAREWRTVRITRPARIGSQRWDAGTAEPLRVRASISDTAGNVTEKELSLPEGVPANPGRASNDPLDFSSPPPISQISSGPSFPPVDEGLNEPAPPPQEPFPAPRRAAPRSRPPAAREPAPFPDEPAAPAPTAGEEPRESPEPGRSRTLLVSSPRFPLKYAVEDAGPNGPGTVELWVTQDGGRNWSPRGQDSDRVTPFPVDLGGEGTFGLCLVARSASGLGDLPPASGDPPQFWVEVDSTPPDVQLLPTRVGTGQHIGQIAIAWRAADLHLGQRPVMLFWKTEEPGAKWTPITPEPIANTTRAYIWTVPPDVPPRFHLRVEVTDEAGNHGSAETTETGPVNVDRTRPRSRIIGLDPSARTGANPMTRPYR
jgi:hypothetical protein